MRTKNYLHFALVLITILCIATRLSIAQEKPSGEAAKSYVIYLASDALQGRDTGTPGFEKAVQWVVEKFKSWGLEPAGNNGTYIQEFPFDYYKDEFEYPELIINDRKFYPRDREFDALKYSGGGKIIAEVVFVGFGINAPDKGLDEYAGLDVKNKIVLAMRGCPTNDEKKWEGFESDSSKVATAMAKGAIGVMICANFGEEDRGIGRWRLQPGNYKPGFLVFGVGAQVVDYLLMKKDETYRMLEQRVRNQFDSLNQELKPMSVATSMTAIMKVKVENDPTRIGKNVLGMIKGTDPVVGDKVIVLGAHLDHLGIEYNQIYNGADDNASGTSVVMEVARVMMANKIKPKRTILFACWGGEERGLLGSRYYADHPLFPIDKTVMDFNMDMVGLGNKLSFPGIYYAPEIWKIIKANLSEPMLEFIEPSRGGPGGSDHTPFITRGVPAFALMTTPWNGHPDYHQPGDDADKISAELLGKVAQFVYDNALLIANYDGNLIVANRLPIYIHKSANIIDIHPIPYEPGMAILDSLQTEWIDIQFVEVPPDSLYTPDIKLAEMVKTLDAGTEEESDISHMMGPMARMFRSRRDQTTSVMGLNGVPSVNSNLADLRIAGKLGAKFFIFDGVDGKWITANDGLTKDGKKAIQELNNEKMLILLQNLPENAMVQIMETSKNPVVLAGVKGADSISDSLVQKVNEKDGLIALAFCPDKIDKLVERIEALKQRTKISHIGLYPCPENALDIKNLDQMLNLTIALNQKGYQEDEIRDILGGNLRTIFDKINPRDQRRMRRPF
jgi:microsomal dipeptidase-like Zn-dependent dipeptidase